MKKLVKGIAVMSLSTMLFAGGCKKDQVDEIPQEQQGEKTTVAVDFNNDLENLYNEVLPSVVRVHAGNSLGTGVVYKEEGDYAYIITNAHVLTDKEGAKYYDNIEIVFSNYNKVKGTFIYLDKNEDVAVISIKKSDNYKVAKIIENDTDVDVGESVFSIGHPHKNYFAMTTGNISSTRIETTTDYISGSSSTKTFVYNSTASINSGNSGGPMFNTKGEVIAINTMYPSDSSKYRDFNYSIPINHFIKVADYLVINRTNYSKATLGITVKSVSDYSITELAAMGVTVKKGAYITSNSDANLQKGRVITHVNGQEIDTAEDYYFEMLKYSKDQTITITTIDVVGINARDVNVKLK